MEYHNILLEAQYKTIELIVAVTLYIATGIFVTIINDLIKNDHESKSYLFIIPFWPIFLLIRLIQDLIMRYKDAR